MLNFYVSGEPLLLDENTSVSLKYYNPFFSFREFNGDYGLGIDIPVNSVNEAILGSPQRYEKQRDPASNKIPDFSVRIDGAHIMTGTLIIRDASTESYSAWLQGPVGIIGSEYREKDIHENPLFSVLKIFDNKSSYSNDVDDYCCPTVFNPFFFENIGKNFPDTEESLLNYQFRASAAGYVNYKNPDGTVKNDYSSVNIDAYPENLEVYAVTPMLFVSFILKELLRSVYYEIENTPFDSYLFLQNLCIYNNFDITTSYFDQSGNWFNANWFDQDVLKATGKDFGRVTRSCNLGFYYSQLLPRISLKDFLISVQNISNTFFHFKRRYKADVLSRENIILGSSIDIDKYMVGNWKIGTQKDVTLKFTFEQDQNDNIISERFVNLDDRRDDIKEELNNWDDVKAITDPDFGEIHLLKDEHIFVEYRWIKVITKDETTNEEIVNDQLGWEHISFNMQNGYYNYGKSEEEQIPTKFATFSGIVPSAQQQGDMGSAKLSEKKFAPRICSQYGTIPGNFVWEGNDGLIARNWPNTARFLSSRLPVKGTAIMPANVIDYVLRNLPYKFRTREGEFLIETLSFTVNTTTLGEITMEGYKI